MKLMQLLLFAFFSSTNDMVYGAGGNHNRNEAEANMGYTIDPRRQIDAVQARIDLGTDDEKTTRNLRTMLAHMKAEAAGDFDALMATVSPDAAYTNFNTGPDSPHSPRSKAEVGVYYRSLVEAHCHQIEHALDRIVADRDAITTEGEIRIAYPAAVLRAMGHDVGDAAPYYLYVARMMIVWGFDADGLVRCEDSYNVMDGFDGIANRPVRQAEIYSIPI